MKLELTKEWCEKSADIEGDSEVGAGSMTRLVLAWRRFRCRRGYHEMRSIPTGLKRLPWYVGECIHCGMIHDGVATPWGGVIIGEWPSYDDFIRSQNGKDQS